MRRCTACTCKGSRETGGGKSTRVRVRASHAGPRVRVRGCFSCPRCRGMVRGTHWQRMVRAHSRPPAMALGLTPVLCCPVPFSALAGTAVATSPITAAKIWPRDQATQRKKEELAPSPLSAAGGRGARAGTADRRQWSQLPDDPCDEGASGCGDSAAGGRGARAGDESWPGGRFRRASTPQTSVRVRMFQCT